MEPTVRARATLLWHPGHVAEAGLFAGHARVETSTAVGRVAAEIVCPYPPGIPILYPGEKISEEALEFLRAFKREGGYVSGCSDATLDTLLVVE